jgi:hypothetical protein
MLHNGCEPLCSMSGDKDQIRLEAKSRNRPELQGIGESGPNRWDCVEVGLSNKSIRKRQVFKQPEVFSFVHSIVSTLI